jgi:hypothetical protein
LLTANADSSSMMRIGDKALSDTNDIFARATRLRELARRYGLLAETLYDPSIVAVVQDCVSELEREAAQEEAKFRVATRAA